MESKGYIFCTAHRQENVDSVDRFKGIIEGMSLVGRELEKKVIYAIHPRARKMLELLKIKIPENVNLIATINNEAKTSNPIPTTDNLSKLPAS